MACRTDPALIVVGEVTAALASWFGPGQCPPLVGSTDAVRYFAGDAAPLAAWDAHSNNGKTCGEPFVWVRIARRFASKTFPAPAIITECKAPRVLALECGVGWCAVVDQEPRWKDYEAEAQQSSDVAWRLESAMCEAAGRLQRLEDPLTTGLDTLVPYGPEGGVIAWTGYLYSTY